MESKPLVAYSFKPLGSPLGFSHLSFLIDGILFMEAAVLEWLSSWLAEQGFKGSKSNRSLATSILEKRYLLFLSGIMTKWLNIVNIT